MITAGNWVAFFFGGWGSITTIYVLLQIAALARARGKALYVVLAPLLVFLISIYVSADAYKSDSNLWPVPMLVTSAVGILYLAVAAAVRYLGRRANG
jgi:hypothetical protein